MSGISALASPKPWTPRSAAWGSTGPTSLELITRSVRAAKARDALVFSGAGTDHLAVEDAKSIDDVIRAYEEQIAAVEKVGGRIILMASRALAKIGRNADDYAKVYDRVLSQVREPVIIHWLGDMFDPALSGLLGHGRSRSRDGHGGRDHQRATPPRSMASKSRCSTSSARSTCAGVSPRT